MFLNFATASQAVSVSQVGQQHQLWEPLLNHPRICSLSSNLDALTTELLEALWWAGSKFNYNYTSHWGLYRGLARNWPFTSVWDQDRTIWVGKKKCKTRKLRKILSSRCSDTITTELLEALWRVAYITDTWEYRPWIISCEQTRLSC